MPLPALCDAYAPHASGLEQSPLLSSHSLRFLGFAVARSFEAMGATAPLEKSKAARVSMHSRGYTGGETRFGGADDGLYSGAAVAIGGEDERRGG